MFFPLFMIIGYMWPQYVITSNQGILKQAIEQLKKIPLKEQRGAQERLHLKSLHSKIDGEQGLQDVSFLHSFLLPILKWADKHLGDYHLHYAEVTTASIPLWELYFDILVRMIQDLVSNLCFMLWEVTSALFSVATSTR